MDSADQCQLCPHLHLNVLLQALIDVAKVFGDSWTSANLVPAILQQLDEPFYLFRITCMQVRHPFSHKLLYIHAAQCQSVYYDMLYHVCTWPHNWTWRSVRWQLVNFQQTHTL